MDGACNWRVEYFPAGIRLYHAVGYSADHCNISNNNVSNNYQGIYLICSNNNKILNNAANSNKDDGIHLYSSSNNLIINNDIISNHEDGIHIGGGSNNKIINNDVRSNGNDGIDLDSSSNNMIINNKISLNHDGIDLACSSNNEIVNNNASNNIKGIWLDGTDTRNNNITNNNVSNNNYGIYLRRSDNNIISGNNISSNDLGIYLIPLGYPISNNIIYHNNFISNTQNAYDECTNIWDNGYPSGGNYWSNWASPDSFSGPNQDQPDGDEIVDSPYNISGGVNQDRYPLVYQSGGEQDPIPPTITLAPPTPANNSEITVDYVFVNVTLNENGNTALLNWNGTNKTMLGSNMNFYLNKTGLSNGIYTYRVYANDTSGNWNVSGARVVTVNVPASITDIESSSETGVRKDLFNAEESVFASGSNYAINKDYNISVVADQTWTDGMDIPDRAAGTANKVFTDSSGDVAYSDPEGAGTPPALIWNAAVNGTYDIVIDVNDNGKYDAGIDVLDDGDLGDAGFVVVTSPVEVPAITPLSFLLSLLTRLGLGAVAMRTTYKKR